MQVTIPLLHREVAVMDSPMWGWAKGGLQQGRVNGWRNTETVRGL